MSDFYSPHPVAPSATYDERTLPCIIYGLYLAGFITGGLTTLVGFGLAYALSGQGTDLQRSHYLYQIRTVWIVIAALAAAVSLTILGFPLSLLAVGILLWAFSGIIIALLGIWFAVRTIVGLARILQDRPNPPVRSWMF